jgi:hypothetical protein
VCFEVDARWCLQAKVERTTPYLAAIFLYEKPFACRSNSISASASSIGLIASLPLPFGFFFGSSLRCFTALRALLSPSKETREPRRYRAARRRYRGRTPDEPGRRMSQK